MKVQINEPCPESWDEMKIGVNSRYCDNCDKDVQDFTDKSRQQILEYLLLNQGQRTCGRMRKSQIDFTNDEVMLTINRLSKKSSNPNFAFYLLTIGSMFIASCSSTEADNSNQLATPGEKVQIEAIDSLDSDTIVSDTIGETQQKVDSLEVLPPLPPPMLGEVLMGDVEFIGVDSLDINIPEPKNISTTPEEDSLKIHTFVEVMPEFHGGLDSLTAFIDSILLYPKADKEMGVEGMVVVKFIVEPNGSISNPTIARSITKDMDKEVLRIMKIMPDWKPGTQRNEAKRVQMHLPIRFKLN
jgi:TonB family protein